MTFGANLQWFENEKHLEEDFIHLYTHKWFFIDVKKSQTFYLLYIWYKNYVRFVGNLFPELQLGMHVFIMWHNTTIEIYNTMMNINYVQSNLLVLSEQGFSAWKYAYFLNLLCTCVYVYKHGYMFTWLLITNYRIFLLNLQLPGITVVIWKQFSVWNHLLC